MEKITSRKNKICTHMKKLGTSRSYREENKEFLCDGAKLLSEALKADIEVLCILSTNKIPQAIPPETRIYYADESLIDSLSPLSNSQGILFTCRTPEIIDNAYISGEKPSPGTHILLDRIQDPGNVGTIIRSAYAFGIKSVMDMGGLSADLFNLKTIRASMGAVFHQKITYTCLNEAELLAEAGVRFIAATNEKEATEIENINLNNAIIIIGNESRGIGDPLKYICNETVRIPISPNCESLNAATAAAIIMWEATRNDK